MIKKDKVLKANKKNVEEVIIEVKPLTIKERVIELKDSGLETRKIRGTLVLADYTDREIDAAFIDAGLKVKRATLVTYPEVLRFIAESPKTEKELAVFILEEATGNENRYFSERNKIRVLVNEIYRKFTGNVKEEAAEKDLLTLVKNKGLKKVEPEKKKAGLLDPIV